MNPVVSNILAVAKERGIKDQEICRILGAKKDKVNNWKIEQSTPSVDEVLTLAHHFNVTTDYLLGRTNNLTVITSKDDVINKFEKERKKMKNRVNHDILLEVLYDLFCEQRNINSEGENCRLSVEDAKKRTSEFTDEEFIKASCTLKDLSLAKIYNALEDNRKFAPDNNEFEEDIEEDYNDIVSFALTKKGITKAAQIKDKALREKAINSSFEEDSAKGAG